MKSDLSHDQPSAGGPEAGVSSGSLDQSGATTGDSGEHTVDQVSYDTHRKLLAEKKRVAEELSRTRAQLDALNREKEEAERRKLEEQGEWKKLHESEKKRAEELAAKLSERDEKDRNILKLGALLDKLPGKVEKPYMPLIYDHLERVAIDPETGAVDEQSAAAIAREIEQNYPKIITRTRGGIPMPSEAPKTGSQSLGYDEWLKLPAAEMRKRYKDVRDSAR